MSDNIDSDLLERMNWTHINHDGWTHVIPPDYGELGKSAVSAVSGLIQLCIDIERDMTIRFNQCDVAFRGLSQAINEIGTVVVIKEVFDIDLSYLAFPQPSKPKYDPFNAVDMWKKPRRHKRPYKHVKYNQCSYKQPYRSRK